MKLSFKKNLLIIVLIFCISLSLIGCSESNMIACRSNFKAKDYASNGIIYCDYEILGKASTAKEIDDIKIKVYFGHDGKLEANEIINIVYKKGELLDIKEEVAPIVSIGIFFQYYENYKSYNDSGWMNETKDGEYILWDDYHTLENSVLVKELTLEEFNSDDYNINVKSYLLIRKLKYKHNEIFTIPQSLLSHDKGIVSLWVKSICQTSDGKYIPFWCGYRVFNYVSVGDGKIILENGDIFSETQKERYEEAHGKPFSF